MKLCRKEHKVEGVVDILEYIATSSEEDIQGDIYEVFGEDENGNECSSDFSICQVMDESAALIKDLQQQCENFKGLLDNDY